MNFKKAGSILLLSLITVLSSCGFESNEPKAEKIYKEKKKYTITVSNTVSPVGLKAMDIFCEKAKELSDGDLNLVYKVSEDALDDFYSGSDFIFASNEEISRANGDFASYTSPFYFEDSESALLTLNSPQFLDLTADVTQSLLNGKQLGCFYDGSYVFVSSKIDDLLQFSGSGEFLSGFNGLRIYGDFKYIDEYITDSMGINAISCTPEDAVNRFNAAQTHTVMIKKHDTDKLKLSEKREIIYYYDQPYKFDFNWLFISDEVMEDMSTDHLDIIKEAAAYALGYNDETLMDMEKKGEESLTQYPFVDLEYSYKGACNFVEKLYKDISFKRIWDVNNHNSIKELLA